MMRQGWKPNASTYTSILGACNHACEIKLALQHFMSMTEEHGIRPTLEHFDCVIDLLARSGFLEEADRLLQSMPFFPDSFAWSSLLSACKVYDNIDVGRHCFQNIASMNPTSAASYMLMSNIYANVEILEGCTD
jgi:pentatricopeptide repeat protein